MASCQELSERTCQSTGSAGKLLIGQQTQELRQQFDEYRQELGQVDQRLRDVHDKSVPQSASAGWFESCASD